MKKNTSFGDQAKKRNFQTKVPKKNNVISLFEFGRFIFPVTEILGKI